LVKGFFLVLEGIDGSGKTTIALKLKEVYEERGKRVLITREPSDNILGRFIRDYLNKVAKADRDPIFEALAFAADRALHLREVIEPYISKGYLVISDRYLYSSLAYQSINGIECKWLLEVNKYMLKPDLAIFLDVKPRSAIKRIKHARNVFEKIEFLEKVYASYLDMVENRMLIKVDGEREREKIVGDIIKLIDEKWK
jgi:dTMP kinase